MSSRAVFRAMIRQSPSTDHNRLRMIEKELIQYTFSNLAKLAQWLSQQGFYSFEFLGDPHHCDQQFFKPNGQSRWHLRAYDYPEKIVIICEIDFIDPIGPPDQLLARIFGHWLVDSVLDAPIKHVIHLPKN